MHHSIPFGLFGVFWKPEMFEEAVIYLVFPWPPLPYFSSNLLMTNSAKQQCVGGKFTDPKILANPCSLVGQWRFDHK